MARGGKRSGAGRKPGSVHGAPSGTATFVVTESGSDRPCKVGIAANLRAKLSAMAGGNPRTLALRHWEAVEAATRESCEAAINARLAAHRLKGDWFDVSVDVAIAAVSDHRLPPVPHVRVRLAASAAAAARRERFCQEYVIDYNGARAYAASGYKPGNGNVAKVEAHRLLTNPNVRAMVAALEAEHLEGIGLRLIGKNGKIGKVLPPDELPADLAAVKAAGGASL